MRWHPSEARRGQYAVPRQLSACARKHIDPGSRVFGILKAAASQGKPPTCKGDGPLSTAAALLAAYSALEEAQHGVPHTARNLWQAQPSHDPVATVKDRVAAVERTWANPEPSTTTPAMHRPAPAASPKVHSRLSPASIDAARMVERKARVLELPSQPAKQPIETLAAPLQPPAAAPVAPPVTTPVSTRAVLPHVEPPPPVVLESTSRTGGPVLTSTPPAEGSDDGLSRAAAAVIAQRQARDALARLVDESASQRDERQQRIVAVRANSQRLISLEAEIRRARESIVAGEAQLEAVTAMMEARGRRGRPQLAISSADGAHTTTALADGVQPSGPAATAPVAEPSPLSDSSPLSERLQAVRFSPPPPQPPYPSGSYLLSERIQAVRESAERHLASQHAHGMQLPRSSCSTATSGAEDGRRAIDDHLEFVLASSLAHHAAAIEHAAELQNAATIERQHLLGEAGGEALEDSRLISADLALEDSPLLQPLPPPLMSSPMGLGMGIPALQGQTPVESRAPGESPAQPPCTSPFLPLTPHEAFAPCEASADGRPYWQSAQGGRRPLPDFQEQLRSMQARERRRWPPPPQPPQPQPPPRQQQQQAQEQEQPQQQVEVQQMLPVLPRWTATQSRRHRRVVATSAPPIPLDIAGLRPTPPPVAAQAEANLSSRTPQQIARRRARRLAIQRALLQAAAQSQQPQPPPQQSPGGQRHRGSRPGRDVPGMALPHLTGPAQQARLTGPASRAPAAARGATATRPTANRQHRHVLPASAAEMQEAKVRWQVRLDEEALERHTGGDTECVICLGEMEPHEPLVHLPCNQQRLTHQPRQAREQQPQGQTHPTQQHTEASAPNAICAPCEDQCEGIDQAAEDPVTALEPQTQAKAHLFHADCLSRWLLTSAACPTCRKPVRSMLTKSRAAAQGA